MQAEGVRVTFHDSEIAHGRRRPSPEDRPDPRSWLRPTFGERRRPAPGGPEVVTIDIGDRIGVRYVVPVVEPKIKSIDKPDRPPVFTRVFLYPASFANPGVLNLRVFLERQVAAHRAELGTARPGSPPRAYRRHVQRAARKVRAARKRRRGWA